MADGPEYDVGYGKPPKHTRFKKGQSGNSKGRPKGSRGIKTDLREELEQRITLTENGTRRTITKQQAIVKSLVMRAIKGDPRASQLVANLTIQVLGAEDEGHKGSILPTSDQAIIDAFIAQQKKGG